jgi:hypothetical protein
MEESEDRAEQSHLEYIWHKTHDDKAVHNHGLVVDGEHPEIHFPWHVLPHVIAECVPAECVDR